MPSKSTANKWRAFVARERGKHGRNPNAPNWGKEMNNATQKAMEKNLFNALAAANRNRQAEHSANTRRGRGMRGTSMRRSTRRNNRR